MIIDYPKLEKRTLVEDFISQFEEMILTGKLSIGEKLPSERDLAIKMGVSRPVIHDGLINLAEKGLITRLPNGGAVVNDYRREGSLGFMITLLNFQKGNLDPGLTKSTMEFRRLFETECARLAALNRTEKQIVELRSKLDEEKAEKSGDLLLQAVLDFQLHHLIALASGNIFYPMLLISCKPLYINFASMFYSIPGIRPAVLQFHTDLVEAIIRKDPDHARAGMVALLEHGEVTYLSSIHS